MPDRVTKGLRALIRQSETGKLGELERYESLILEARQSGKSIRVIATVLTDSGLQVSTETVRRFLNKKAV